MTNKITKIGMYSCLAITLMTSSCKKETKIAPEETVAQVNQTTENKENLPNTSTSRLTTSSTSAVRSLLESGPWISPKGGKCIFSGGKYFTVIRANDLPANSTVGLQLNYSLTLKTLLSDPYLILPGTGFASAAKTIINIISSAFPQNNARVFVLKIGSTHTFVIKNITTSSMTLVEITSSQIGYYPTTTYHH